MVNRVLKEESCVDHLHFTEDAEIPTITHTTEDTIEVTTILDSA